MPEQPITVGDVFELPAADAPEGVAPRWQTLREWISQELNGAKAPSMEEIASRVGELLEIPIASIFLTSWKKTDTIRDLLDESRAEPASILTIELDEHSITSQHRPYIEVRSKREDAKKLQFRVRLIFQLNDFVLTLANGSITEMRPGPCEMRGTLEYQGLTVAEKPPGPIRFPEKVELEKAESSPITVEPPPPQVLEPPTPEKVEAVAAETVESEPEPGDSLVEEAFRALEAEWAKPHLGTAPPAEATEAESEPVSEPEEVAAEPTTPAVAAAAAAGAGAAHQRDVSPLSPPLESASEATEVTDSKPDTDEREEFVL